jgi:sulfatase maturation enzyme AslB (radical SAM superfamily)
LPFLTDNYFLNFYGGEPLLCFDLIKQALSFLDEKNKEFDKTPHYSLTTNGSLITEEIIQTLDEHKFLVEFSFDGLAQNLQRKQGNFDKTVSNIEKILKFPNLRLEINSVFTPATVDRISESLGFMMGMGLKDLHLSLSLLRPWNRHSLSRLKREMTQLRKNLISHYKRTGEIPLTNFREEGAEGFFYCAGGQDRLAFTSEEQIWGCDLFADYFRGKEGLPECHDYFFGSLDTFSENHKKIYPRISSNYAKLSMDNFQTPHMKCLFCSNLESCTICPVAAAFSGNPIGEVPAYACEIQKIKSEEKEKFKSSL